MEDKSKKKTKKLNFEGVGITMGFSTEFFNVFGRI